MRQGANRLSENSHLEVFVGRNFEKVLFSEFEWADAEDAWVGQQ